jgi:hypothetical protein
MLGGWWSLSTAEYRWCGADRRGSIREVVGPYCEYHSAGWGRPVLVVKDALRLGTSIPVQDRTCRAHDFRACVGRVDEAASNWLELSGRARLVLIEGWAAVSLKHDRE